ncbi:MAG TPA: hypothetical protein DCE41_32650 [Cytophagales bacterium]|nr:hypothetical protein [Cytophagales bacterium]HAA24371.1 hypothetical protein [Cytophagales bacterium]HAP64431.1 hypothetical protein [Cytophagales bacterium]
MNIIPRVFLASLLGLVITNSVRGQEYATSDPDYIRYVEAGLEQLQSEDWEACLESYSAAFSIKQTSFLSTLRYATCAYYVQNEALYREQVDKAMEIDGGGSYTIFSSNPEFQSVQNTALAEYVTGQYWASLEQAGYDIILARQLEEIYREDQQYRMQLGGIEEEFGQNSPEVRAHWAKIREHDLINTEKITQLLDTLGYPGESVVGEGMADVAFLVIQHADLEVQLKYLDMITEAADAGELEWSSVALLIDRTRMRQGQPQLYGSQIYSDQYSDGWFIAEIEDPFQVDERRAEVGLGPLAEYAARFDLQWDPQAHLDFHAERKQRMAESEEE